MVRRSVWLLVVLLVLGALALRSLFWREVFVGGDDTVLAMADASYHARRALFSFVRFPEILHFDPYLAYPDGANVPLPPLYDWLLAAAGRALGNSQAVFERVAAWAAPVLGALTVVPVFLAGRCLYGTGAGLGAATLFALLSIHVEASRLGNPDHHAAVALLSAILLGLSLRLAHRRGQGDRLVLLAVGLTLARASLVLTWSGSLLYLALLDGTLLFLGVVARRNDVLWVEAASVSATCVMVAPFVAAAGAPIGGTFSATELSWLHVFMLGAIAMLASGVALLERVRPTRGVSARLVRAAALAGVCAALLLVLPGARETFGKGLSFLAARDLWMWSSTEQAPLFAWLADGRPVAVASPLPYYGYLLYLLPLALAGLAATSRTPAERHARIVLACWSLVLGLLAVKQFRFGVDFAPTASVLGAHSLAQARRWVGELHPRLMRPSGIAALLAGAALVWPCVSGYHRPKLERQMRLQSAYESGVDLALFTRSGTAVRFAEMVRELTPETRGYFDPNLRPEYGIVAPLSLGHVLAYVARRAAPAGNLGPYLDEGKYRAVRKFFLSRSEEEALALLEPLRTRYVITAESQFVEPGTMLHLLQRGDGTQLRRFRLITEGPAGGHPLAGKFQGGTPLDFLPYKLFEVVAGAMLEARVAPGTRVTARVEVLTPTGRRFAYRTGTRADASGVAYLRVPYPTGSEMPTRVLGDYRVRVGSLEMKVPVSEEAVRSGRTIALGR